MKTISTLVALLSLILFSSCEKLEDLTTSIQPHSNFQTDSVEVQVDLMMLKDGGMIDIYGQVGQHKLYRQERFEKGGVKSVIYKIHKYDSIILTIINMNPEAKASVSLTNNTHRWFTTIDLTQTRYIYISNISKP